MQQRGGSGASLGARVMRISVPQMLHLYSSRTLRSSPAGGGSGTGCEKAAISLSPKR